MELRPELQPPVLEEPLVMHLARLAATIDGGAPGEWETALDEFNGLANTHFTFADFQGISGGEEHDEWVRRVLLSQRVRPVPDVTREELIEIVRRAMPQNRHPDQEAYALIFEANVPRPKASNLIYYPPDYDETTGTWNSGRPMGEYAPTPAQIVDWSRAEAL